jgi:tRNA modification GTPase
VERIGIERAWDQITKADAVVFVHDLARAEQQDYVQADAQIAAQLGQLLGSDVPVLHVWNKMDVTGMFAPQASHHFALSAKTGLGLDALRQELLHLVGWNKSQPEGIFMARERHVQALQMVQFHLENSGQWLQSHALALDLLAEELRLAQNALNSITGAFTSDDLLGVIFSKFCIGK